MSDAPFTRNRGALERLRLKLARLARARRELQGAEADAARLDRHAQPFNGRLALCLSLGRDRHVQLRLGGRVTRARQALLGFLLDAHLLVDANRVLCRRLCGHSSAALARLETTSPLCLGFSLDATCYRARRAHCELGLVDARGRDLVGRLSLREHRLRACSPLDEVVLTRRLGLRQHLQLRGLIA